VCSSDIENLKSRKNKLRKLILWIRKQLKSKLNNFKKIIHLKNKTLRK